MKSVSAIQMRKKVELPNTILQVMYSVRPLQCQYHFYIQIHELQLMAVHVLK